MMRNSNTLKMCRCEDLKHDIYHDCHRTSTSPKPMDGSSILDYELTTIKRLLMHIYAVLQAGWLLISLQA